MSNLVSTIFKTFILGPIIGASYSSNKWSSFIIIAVVDAMLYGICLYLSIETTNRLGDQLIIKQQKQSLLSSHQAMEVLLRTQGDLYDLVKDSVMIIKKNIDESLDYFNQSISTHSFLSDRIDFYTCTSSLLLYIQQPILWFLQYLTTKNPKQYLTCSFILSAVLLTQSLGFLYFLQMTNISPFPSALSIYACMVFLRSFISIYHHAYVDYLF